LRFLVAPRRGGAASDWPEPLAPFCGCCWLSHGSRGLGPEQPHPTPPLQAPSGALVCPGVSLVLQGLPENSSGVIDHPTTPPQAGIARRGRLGRGPGPGQPASVSAAWPPPPPVLASVEAPQPYPQMRRIALRLEVGSRGKPPRAVRKPKEGRGLLRQARTGARK
jgi:hypothetical protein